MATYPDDATGSFTLPDFSSMADKKPDKGFSEELEFQTVKFDTEAGYEKRRLVSRRGKRKFSLRYTNVNGLAKQAIQNFYRARSGDFESFTFDLGHLGQSGTATVRFEGTLKINEVRSGGANVIQDVYSVSFDLQETYD
jgi:hypothetical protein